MSVYEAIKDSIRRGMPVTVVIHCGGGLTQKTMKAERWITECAYDEDLLDDLDCMDVDRLDVDEEGKGIVLISDTEFGEIFDHFKAEFAE